MISRIKINFQKTYLLRSGNIHSRCVVGRFFSLFVSAIILLERLSLCAHKALSRKKSKYAHPARKRRRKIEGKKEKKTNRKYSFGVQIEKATQWHSTVNFLRENTHHQPYTRISAHNFIGWHATVVNDKGIDTLDSMMFRLFIFMCVFSYLEPLCAALLFSSFSFFLSFFQFSIHFCTIPANATVSLSLTRSVGVVSSKTRTPRLGLAN